MIETLIQHIGYLIIQVIKAHRNRAAAVLGEYGLHPGQELVLLIVTDDGTRPGEIAAQMGVEAPTVTRMLQRMESNGFIERRPDPDDARASLVYLTAQGQALVEAVQQMWADLDTTLLAGFTETEKALLRRMVLQMLDNFDR